MKIGDVVMLKSGGPEMTIQSIDSEDHVVCYWFEVEGFPSTYDRLIGKINGKNLHSETFHKKGLVLGADVNEFLEWKKTTTQNAVDQSVLDNEMPF